LISASLLSVTITWANGGFPLLCPGLRAVQSNKAYKQWPEIFNNDSTLTGLLDVRQSLELNATPTNPFSKSGPPSGATGSPE
jgi:hypothetical protein